MSTPPTTRVSSSDNVASSIDMSSPADASQAQILASVAEVCEGELRPAVRDIDENGVYPEPTMRSLGGAGLYAQHLSNQGLASSIDMPLAIEAMSLVGYECLSTAFCVWCHDACGWYLEKTQNETLRERLLPEIASGGALGATGLSNPMKFYSDIEPLRVFGERVSDGYVINGSLPWVSNLGEDHYFGVVFEMKDAPEQRVMAMVQCNQPGVALCDGGRFIALEGSATFATRFENCFIPDASVLADPADEYIKAIRPGFVLMQVGMAIGLVRSCAAIMRKQDKTHWHVNQFLPHADSFEEQAQELLDRTKRLAQTPHETSASFMLEALQSRLDAGELSLAAAQACMLNGGARAYAVKSNQYRKLREAYFVGVVTPATKHLRKEISRLQSLTT